MKINIYYLSCFIGIGLLIEIHLNNANFLWQPIKFNNFIYGTYNENNANFLWQPIKFNNVIYGTYNEWYTKPITREYLQAFGYVDSQPDTVMPINCLNTARWPVPYNKEYKSYILCRIRLLNRVRWPVTYKTYWIRYGGL